MILYSPARVSVVVADNNAFYEAKMQQKLCHDTWVTEMRQLVEEKTLREVTGRPVLT